MLFSQIGTEDQMYWFGRPAHAPRIFDHEGVLSAKVKRQQSIAYAELSALQNKLTVDM